MAGKIFINYRRGLNRKDAQHLFTQLLLHFPRHRLFIDQKGLDNVPDWLHELERRVAGSAIMLALIGPGWADVRNESGSRRIDDRHDIVRFEIGEAIRRGIPVIPVRIDDAPMPSVAELPQDLWLMTRPQANPLRTDSFEADAETIAKRIKATLSKPICKPKLALALAGAAALVAGIAAGPWLQSALGVLKPPPALLTALEKARAEFKAAQDALSAEMRRHGAAKAQAEALTTKLEETQRNLNEMRLALEAAQNRTGEAEAALAALRTQPGYAPAKGSGGPASKTAARPLAAEEAATLAQSPGQVFRECENCPQMVVVPAGSFTMGSLVREPERSGDEGPQRPVTIGKPFAAGMFPVTFGEWAVCADEGGCKGNRVPSDENWGRSERPAVNVSWNNAKEYISWLNWKTNGGHYRLLSEAEWEYAARAGTTSRFSWGDGLGEGNANCAGCSSQWDKKQTAPVTSFAPNRFGLFGMHGNVWHWTEDCWHQSYDGAPAEGVAWVTENCSGRAARGGSWSSTPKNIRSAARNSVSASYSDSEFGFRVARTLVP